MLRLEEDKLPRGSRTAAPLTPAAAARLQTIVPNLRHADCVRILCGTLDRLPQAFAQLDASHAPERRRQERQKRNAELRRRNRAWARDARP